jgi:hypothetical protein
VTAAVWRPNRREAYPVLGVERLHADGVHADVVVEWPALGPGLAKTVPLSQIEGDCPGLPPNAEQVRSIVRALTADFVDHSRADRCRCGGLRDSGTSHPQAVAQAGAGGEAAPVTNFPQ